MIRGSDFISEDFFRDPVRLVDELRATAPLVKVRFPIIGTVWMTTTQEMAGRVLKDSATFTLRKEGGALAGMRWWMPGMLRVLATNMLTMDSPTTRACAASSMRRSAVARCSTWSRALRRWQTNSSMLCLPTARRPIS